MVVAKWCGMRVERFSIFFGRPLARFQRGRPSTRIGWLPVGGYVKISGMTRDEEIPADLVPRAYYSATMWRKIATIAAGPAVNILVAIVCLHRDVLGRHPERGRADDAPGTDRGILAGRCGGDAARATRSSPSTASAAPIPTTFRKVLAAHPNETRHRDLRPFGRRRHTHGPAQVGERNRRGLQPGHPGRTVSVTWASASDTPPSARGSSPGISKGIDYTWWVVHETATRYLPDADPGAERGRRWRRLHRGRLAGPGDGAGLHRRPESRRWRSSI